MSFSNIKEDIIEFHLTEDGQELLSKGLYKPYYYSFSDKDIIYNHAEVYSGTLSGFENRIAYTPRILCYNTGSILGMSEVLNNKKPSFYIKCIKGYISEEIERTISSDFSNNIYTITVNVNDSYDYFAEKFIDNSSIILQVIENNSILSKDNFDVELFKIENNKEIKLEFISRDLFDGFQSSFFSEDDDITLIEERPVVNDTVVEYYFHITTDNDILEEYIYENNIEEQDALDIDQEIINC